jgi:hypothetical protein
MDHVGHPSDQYRLMMKSKVDAYRQRHQEIKKKQRVESSDGASNINLQFHPHSALSSSESLQKIVVSIEHKKLQLGIGAAAAKTAVSLG